MNERILELRTQAAAWVAKNHQPQYPNAYSQKEIDQRYLMYEEKFAELIVKECMDIAREVGTSTEPEDFALDRCYEIETKIKEHFGVEE